MTPLAVGETVNVSSSQVSAAAVIDADSRPLTAPRFASMPAVMPVLVRLTQHLMVTVVDPLQAILASGICARCRESQYVASVGDTFHASPLAVCLTVASEAPVQPRETIL